jgi:phosphatidylglycerol:prolipoprotein diacylglycerol transferase
MVFDRIDAAPRHPSQLYEAFLEGLLLFMILKFISQKTQKTGVLFWSFIGCYGFFRFLVEFFREPDLQIGFIWGPLSQGQLLSLPMILIALTLAIGTAIGGKR